MNKVLRLVVAAEMLWQVKIVLAPVVGEDLPQQVGEAMGW